MSNDKTDKHIFVCLDGLRALAILPVAIRHMSKVFHGYLVPDAQLAVDFFLQLSGFVIAYAYSRRIAEGMGFGEFLWHRINRIYPSFIIGIALGILVAVVALEHPNSGLSVNWSPGALACSSFLSLLVLPSGGCGVSLLMFPLNPPMWSVFQEILVNIAFFASFVYLRSARASAGFAVAAFVLCVVPVVVAKDTLDYGVEWPDFLQGALRLGASFLVGVTIFNLGKTSQYQSDLLSGLLFVVVGAVLFCQIDSRVFEVLGVTAIFPLVMLAAVRVRPSSKTFTWLCSNLGNATYVLYVIHKPLYQIVYAAILKLCPQIVGEWGALLGILMIAAFFGIAWVLSVTYEPKARKMLNQLRLRVRAHVIV